VVYNRYDIWVKLPMGSIEDDEKERYRMNRCENENVNNE